MPLFTKSLSDLMTPCIHIGSQYQNTFCGVPLTMSYAFTQLEGLCGLRQNNWAFQVCMFKAFIIIGFLNTNLTKETSENFEMVQRTFLIEFLNFMHNCMRCQNMVQ